MLKRTVAIGIAAVLVATSAAALVALQPPAASEEPVNPQSQTSPAEPPVAESKLLTPVEDVLLELPAALAPVAVPLDLVYNFKVDKEYGILRVEVLGPGGAGLLNNADVKVIGPSGDAVIHYSGSDLLIPNKRDPTNAKPTILGFALNPEPGAYKLQLQGVSSAFKLTVWGIAGVPAFEFAIADAFGKEAGTLSDLRGRVVIIDLMATWCGPCKAAMDVFNEVYGEYSRDEFEIVSVDVDARESEDDLRTLFEKEGWAQWYATMDDGTVNAEYGSGFIPTMAIVDPNGVLIYYEIGMKMNADELRDLINRALGKQ
ncbi:MAG TPA: TlpA disulfide reductase family protein [Candidatus Thermoplasmatota archaeon]|nr:TlpA disulfide reductase family protein [Candidatus Thermoplasmatota archaeon]